MPRDDRRDGDTVTILHAHNTKGRRTYLTKQFTAATNGTVVAKDYDNAKWFGAERATIASVRDLHRLLLTLERDPHACIIRGEPMPDMDMDRTDRKKVENGGKFAEVPRRWVQLDIDGGVPLPPGSSVLADPEDAARHLLDVLAAHAPELEGITAVVQFSSSAGLDEMAAARVAVGLPNIWHGVAKSGLRAHVWYWLQTPLGEAELKRWRERMAAAGLMLDATTLQTIQPHYTAAAVFGAGLRDPLAGRRTILVEGAEDSADLEVPEPQARAYSTIGTSAHTGRGYQGHLEDIGPDGFHAPVLRAVAAFVASNWPAPDLAALKADLRERILAADPGPRSHAEITDRASDRHLDSITAWVMQREAAKRAARAAEPPPAVVSPTFPDRGVSLDAAQVQMAKALGIYAEKLRANLGEATRDSLAGMGQGVYGPATPDAVQAARALDLLLRVTVGGGKSEAAILAAPAVLAAARAAKPEGALYYLTPRHDLNEELRERFAERHPGLRVRIWRGMDADDPARPGDTMCLDPELSQTAGAAGLAHTAACGACPLNGECGYRQQASAPADVWLAAHNLAFHALPSALPNAAALMMDEAFCFGAMAGMDPQKPVEMLLSELLDDRTGAVTRLARNDLLGLRKLAFRVLEAHGEDGLLREAFEATGLTPKRAGEWMDLEWRVAPDVKLSDGMERDAILERLCEAKAAGFSKRRTMLARYVQDLLEGDAVRSIHVKVAAGGTALHFAWREDFAEWAKDVPKVLLDGTTHPDLVRIWSPKVEVVDVEVAAPHQYVRQVPAEFGRSFFENKPQNVRRLADLVLVELASTTGDVLVVAQQKVLALLRKELKARDKRRKDAGWECGLDTSRLHLAHHGAVTGLNRWETVDRALIVGRPAVNRRSGERLAEVLQGAPVAVVADREDDHWPRTTAGIRIADGTGHPVQHVYHPDPVVEAVLRSLSDGAVLQAIGRARGVQRGPGQPVYVTVLAAMALPLTVHEVTTWESLQPDKLDVAMAEAVLAGRALPLAPADLSVARPDQWETPKAVERFLEERRRQGREAGSETPKPPIDSNYRGFGGFASSPRARYRKGSGGGRWSLAMVPQTAGRAALEAEVGPVAAYEFLEPLSEPAAVAPPVQPVVSAPFLARVRPPSPPPPPMLPASPSRPDTPAWSAVLRKELGHWTFRNALGRVVRSAPPALGP